MKFLVDAQLPKLLAVEFKSLGHEAVHTSELPRKNSTPDEDIASFSDLHDMIVVTKDSDFVTSHLLRNTPRKILLTATGNIDNPTLIRLFKKHFSEIEKAFFDCVFVEITPSSLVIHD
jgi:predicted nuclease of predicted toxin-antitoxin system